MNTELIRRLIIVLGESRCDVLIRMDKNNYSCVDRMTNSVERHKKHLAEIDTLIGLLKNQPTNDWIDVNDKLPETEELGRYSRPVYAYIDDGQKTGDKIRQILCSFDSIAGEWFMLNSPRYLIKGITYWYDNSPVSLPTPCDNKQQTCPGYAGDSP